MDDIQYLILNGGEAVGKGTQKKKLLDIYQQAVQVREPGGTPEAEIIRNVLLEKEWTTAERMSILSRLTSSLVINELTRHYLKGAMKEMEADGLSGKAEAFLFAASRAESNEKVVLPAKEKGAVILGDRSVACSMAYQGHARGLGLDFVWELNGPTLEGAHPGLEIFLDLPLEEAERRLQGRTEKQDRLDGETREFHERVREGYLAYYEKYCPYPYVIIDASGTVEEVHEKIKDVINTHKK